ncbi:hypothetical protein Fmac_008999 [Flemingia macrophylla]|uniref:ADP-ribosyl cyclase/cyclic ADP-ribose hydrolase n=1 Tax=Flemingia macrophylla TaxID=520843 RepID=A0ABD1MYZ9_9FABA
MDEKQTISTNSSSIVSSRKYDVFLSFRGEDTRLNFISHLYKALKEKNIETFIDYQLEKGDGISTELIEAIEDSHISIVIFSKNYASSKWCLDELSKIMECKKVLEQIVIPVFYDIDPSHVRKQTESYKKAFAEYVGHSRCSTWRNDLTEASNIVGWDSRNRIESELVDDIVKDVLKKLPAPKQRKGLVGIEKIYEEIKSLLKIGSNEVKTLGIWGMGGIGKTTLANALYDNLSGEFGGRCFLVNISKKSKNLEALHTDLYSKLSREKSPCFETLDLRGLLQRKKVFIVLDDVATHIQLEELIYQFYPLGPGSRVIVTTRNKQIFRSDAITYPVQELGLDHSLELFCLNAFDEKQPKDGYEDISKEVISYCGGIPLALKVVGASLRSKSKEVWECKLNKLQSIPDMEIHKSLKLSYDDLDDDSQRSIFLDIACFFKGELRDNMFPVSEIEVLVDKSLITILDVFEGEVIEMHDLIQEMGHEIIRQESKHQEKRSRLWKHKEVVDVLKKNKGNDVIEGITLGLQKLNEDLYLSSDSLAKMTSLRYFKIHKYWYRKKSFSVYLPDGLDSCFHKLEYLHWDGYCLKSLPSNFYAEQLVVLIMRQSKLKKLWDGVQNLENLKVIDLSGSIHLTHIPDLSKAKNLERVDLSMCESLHQPHPFILSNSKIRFMNLSGCREIESLNIHSKYLTKLHLDRCLSLKEISVTSDDLRRLNLDGVSKLERVNVNSRSLEELTPPIGLSLKEISVVSEEITTLILSRTAITSFSSISSLPKLTYLDLSDCKEIERLNIHSKSLTILVLRGCSSLKEFSVTLDELLRLDLFGSNKLESLNVNSRYLEELKLPGCCSSLKKISVVSEKIIALKLSGSAITSFLSISSLPKLTYLDLSFCKEIDRLDIHSKSLEELQLNGCSSLREISVVSEKITKLELCGTTITSFSSISSLSKLQYLDLRFCKEIERLDLHSMSLRILLLEGCSSLKEISVTSNELTTLDLHGSNMLESLNVSSRPLEKIELVDCSSLMKILVVSEEIKTLSLSRTAITSLSSISSLSKLHYLDLSYCKEIERLDFHLDSLRTLILKDCSSLKEISVVSEELITLSLSGTAITSFASISSLPKLQYLNLSNCKEIERLDVHSNSLQKLELDDCKNLVHVSLPELPSTLYLVSALNCISLETEISQRLVLQHMLQSTIPYLHLRQHPPISLIRHTDIYQHILNSYLRRSCFYGEHYFVFPGDHVIDKCVFHTTENSLSIPCCMLKMSHLSGFIYCIILSRELPSISHRMMISFYQDDVQLWHSQESRAGQKIQITGHVMFWYHDIRNFDRMSKLYDRSKDVEIKFELNGTKGFGVFPVYDTTSGFDLQISESQPIESEQPSSSKRRRT